MPSSTVQRLPQGDSDHTALTLYEEHRQSVFRRTDRLFAWLMGFQFVAGIVAAMIFSPRTWTGSHSTLHPHLWAAIFLGGAISLFPILLAVFRPGRASTRYTISAAQMLTSALLIHLTGGRIETHFHVFGSLAFLAFYRDWRVLVPATLVVAADHFFRGMYYPESVYGVMTASKWRWLEHAGWVLFEDLFLVASCMRGQAEMRQIADRTAALRHIEARYQRIAANVPGMVYQYVLSPDGSARFPFVSEGCREIYGLEPHEIEKDVSVLERMIAPEDYDAFRRSVSESARTLQPWKWEGRYHLPGGVTKWIQGASRPERRPNGEIIWDGLVMDITALKRVEMEMQQAKATAEEASRAKSEFLANMSHEIRTPLNGVIGMLELLGHTSLDSEQRRFGELARSSARSLLTLINDILDFSKIEAGKLELEQNDFDLGVLVADVAEMFSPRLAEKGLELICDVDAGLWTKLRGDAERLRQVLVNLINNAIKFTETGEIVVRAEAVDATSDAGASSTVQLRLSIKDTGIGIPPERIDRLFKSFSQVDASTTRRFGGTGLGLAISKRLVELMGGTIGVKSEPGRGSTFWFTAKFGRSANDASASPVPDLRGWRVLVVDDNATQRGVLRDQLNVWGFEAAVADGGASALALARQAAESGKPFRLILIDAQMPVINGQQLAGTLTTQPWASGSVLVLLAAMQARLLPDEMKRIGVSGCATKPLRQSELFDTLMRACAAAGTSGAAPMTQPQRTASASTPAPSERSGSSIDSTVATSSPRILLAEDNEVNQLVATGLLKKAGYPCDVVSDGKAAVEAALSGQYTLVFMDCQMPEMDGFEATRQIRAKEQQGAAPRIAIVALTANAVKGDRERCLEAGMDGYVSKPLDPKKLLEALEQFMPKAAASQASTTNPAAADGAVESAPAPVSESFPFDLEALHNRCAGDVGLADQLLQRFCGQLDATVRGIADATASGDAANLARRAHQLKGAALTMSANPVGDIAARIEQLARAEQTGLVGDCLAQLEQEVRRCVQFLSCGRTTAESIGTAG